MAELMFGLGQTKNKKATEAKLRQTKAEEWNYKGRIDQDGAFLERKEKKDGVKSYKEAQRKTKADLKDVTQEEDGEMAVRKQQHSREQKWKETGRNQIKKNTNFDMARSLFGGGAVAAPADDEEEEVIEEVVEQVQQLDVQDDDEDEDFVDDAGEEDEDCSYSYGRIILVLVHFFT
eukprot:Nitzschia sp. Nitz4//scaffold208_size52459//38478//39268//NITZ4_006817-RA/size52459-augustus-gene-0.7-mRNA-1//-1//CDS//3329541672//1258//frame0